jgi:large subunit ribosomal protein L21
MLAVIKTGGKQYIVSPQQKIKIEKLDLQEGKEIIFNQVLLIQEKAEIKIGQPFIENATVIGKVLAQDKRKKVIVFRYKSKHGYKKKKGHRQPFTEVEIIKIETK